MNYRETLDFMYSQLPMFQRIGKAAYKADLNNTIKLLSYLGNPETSFKSIHVAGTNGKGSTSHILASVFQEAGYKTGLYTSPHLTDFRERIKIDGEMITKDKVTEFINKISLIIEEIKPSFFELTVAMAFSYFKNENVDIAIIETGLGGRLDSTNVIMPELSVITNIGMDHMQFLGDSRESIAVEKGGIIKKNTPVIIGQADSKLRKLFSKIASDHESSITFAEDDGEKLPLCDLEGNYQKYNIRTALVSLNKIRTLNWTISDESISNGMLNVKNNTGLLGRWQILGKDPKIICDTAHNEDGLKEVLKEIKQEHYSHLHIVLGMVNDKEISSLLALFPIDASYYFCQASVPRSLAVEKLKASAEEYGLKGEAFTSVSEAYCKALEQAEKDGLIYIGGSTFVVADLLTHLKITPPQ